MQRRTATHRPWLLSTALIAGSVVALMGCSSGGPGAGMEESAPEKLEGTVSLWHFFSDREGAVIQSVVDDFEAKNPGVKVDVHDGQDDEKMRKVIAAGGNIDVGLSYSTDVVGNFCSTGAFRDLGPYIERDDVDLSQFSDTVKNYTEYDDVRCAMPILSDVNALFYNQDMFDAAGITEPPKTLAELEQVAEKLTVLNPDGSIKTLGFNPFMGMYENTPSHFGPAVGGEWLNADSTSAIGSDKNWPVLMEWQKNYVDKIGYDKLQAFTAGLGQEFSADNAFQTGQLAMQIDGEYRTAFLEAQAPDVRYGTAPFPTAVGYEDLYGAGYITGNVIGIAKGSKVPELSWALLKYLTTDTEALVKMANGLKNLPTTHAALTSPDLQVTEQYQTFIDIAEHPKTASNPSSPNGGGFQQAFGDYWVKYQSGKGGDLTEGLKGVDKQIDDALDLVNGP
ncbi:extracellular solute-binding protein [Mycetocola spongiae]|uniref:extracellular solute-binding protein n=1 Tax=Mycetocola spongiae TaxID=2859226 RepID=UPI001CF5A21E|nr:extracellular solute-binding protein [Mycetocola spongiae]UCR89836.1 extracellular solute-binding protein [Mycetocola spongiae]